MLLLWRLLFTYEELKPNVLSIIFFLFFSLLFTYEELKLRPDKIRIPFSHLFTIYLWGIETNIIIISIWIINMFTIYLWGIETLLNVILWFGYYMVYYLPMRNWNIEYIELMPIDNKVYYLPMRNWNPLCGISSSKNNPFTIYLWGIETRSN